MSERVPFDRASAERWLERVPIPRPPDLADRSPEYLAGYLDAWGAAWDDATEHARIGAGQLRAALDEIDRLGAELRRESALADAGVRFAGQTRVTHCPVCGANLAPESAP